PCATSWCATSSGPAGGWRPPPARPRRAGPRRGGARAAGAEHGGAGHLPQHLHRGPRRLRGQGRAPGAAPGVISPPAVLARRFVAGETAEAALAAGRRLPDRGIKATFDLLGEDVPDRDAGRRSADGNTD